MALKGKLFHPEQFTINAQIHLSALSPTISFSNTKENEVFQFYCRDSAANNERMWSHDPRVPPHAEMEGQSLCQVRYRLQSHVTIECQWL